MAAGQESESAISDTVILLLLLHEASREILGDIRCPLVRRGLFWPELSDSDVGSTAYTIQARARLERHEPERQARLPHNQKAHRDEQLWMLMTV